MIIDQIRKELKYSASRSSGPGGQHVNKVNTRVTLTWDIKSSQVLEENHKDTLLKKLKSNLTTDGVLIISSQVSRSQLGNKQDVTDKLLELLRKALAVKKKRKPTKPSRAAIEKRLQDKRMKSEKKKFRKGS